MAWKVWKKLKKISVSKKDETKKPFESLKDKLLDSESIRRINNKFKRQLGVITLASLLTLGMAGGVLAHTNVTTYPKKQEVTHYNDKSFAKYILKIVEREGINTIINKKLRVEEFEGGNKRITIETNKKATIVNRETTCTTTYSNEVSMYERTEEISNFTPLQAAVLVGNIDLTKKLLDISDSITDSETKFLVMIIIQRLDKDMLKLLVNRGFNLNFGNNNLEGSAIHLLLDSLPYLYVKEDKFHLMKTFESFLEIILDGGADINKTDYYGRTPLHLLYSIDSRQELLELYIDESTTFRENIAKVLLEKGANPNIKDKKGRTVFDYIKKLKEVYVYITISSREINMIKNYAQKYKK